MKRMPQFCLILCLIVGYVQAQNTSNNYLVDECQDITIPLDENGNVVVSADDLVDELSTGSTASIPVTNENKLFTSLTSDNVGDGVMFDITAIEDVTIKSFDIVLACCIQTGMAVFYKTGTHVGFETDASAWILLEEFDYVQPDDFVLVPLDFDLGISVNAGEVVSFVIVSTEFTATYDYLNGTGVGTVIASDSNIEILEGTGVGDLFQTFFPERRFPGRVVYETTTNESSIELSCEELGTTQVMVEIIDSGGNSTECISNVTVIDDIEPVLVCQDLTVVLDSNGTASLVAEDLLVRGPNTFEIVLTGSNNDSGAPGNTDIMVDITETATLTFDWHFVADDLPTVESFGYLLNGTYIQLTDPNGTITQSGNEMISVALGDVFGFRTRTEVNPFFNTPTNVTISSFSPGLEGQFAPDNWTEVLDNSNGNVVFDEMEGTFLSSDNCGILSYSLDITEVTTSDIGTPVTVTVTGVDATGNEGSCIATVTVEGALGVGENDLRKNFSLYPNPAVAMVSIENNLGVNIEEAGLYDVNGRLISRVTFSENSKQITLDISYLISGLYFINIHTAEGTISKKLIKL